MLLFVAIITAPVVIVSYWLVSHDLLSVEYALLLSLTPIGPAVLVYNRLLLEVSALTERMGLAATDPLGEHIEGNASRGGLLPVNEFFLTMQQYKRVLAKMFTDVKTQQENSSRLFDLLPNAVFVLDKKRHITSFNQAASKLFENLSLSDEITTYLRHPALLKAIDGVLIGSALNASVEFELPNRLVHYVEAHMVKVEGENPEDDQLIITLHDLTSAKKTEKMRVDFIANASHELRTPLAILIGSIETVLGPASDDRDAQTRFLQIMKAQSDRMSRLIDDLLSLSQIEMDEHTRPSKSVNLNELLISVSDMLSAKAASMGKIIQLDLPKTAISIIGDPNQLTQIFTNLTDNALKYSRENAPVIIKLEATQQNAEISVADQGEGIPREHLPRLTERFYRVDRDRSREVGGTGLGLAIVKHIVARHRGHLEIHSVSGKGSVFTVKLPK
ncbi:MAG: ATP-binding protein [Pseudomonas marincola]